MSSGKRGLRVEPFHSRALPNTTHQNVSLPSGAQATPMPISSCRPVRISFRRPGEFIQPVTIRAVRVAGCPAPQPVASDRHAGVSAGYATVGRFLMAALRPRLATGTLPPPRGGPVASVGAGI
jgi:hypothetical protein